MGDQLHLVLMPVHEERAAEFERFTAEVLVPAVQSQRPDLAGRWRTTRASTTTNGVATFVFLLEGGSLTDDWDLGVLLPAHYGEEEAERLFNGWAETFAPLSTWAHAAAAAGEENNQLVLTLEPTSQS